MSDRATDHYSPFSGHLLVVHDLVFQIDDERTDFEISQIFVRRHAGGRIVGFRIMDLPEKPQGTPSLADVSEVRSDKASLSPEPMAGDAPLFQEELVAALHGHPCYYQNEERCRTEDEKILLSCHGMYRIPHL